jgi:hypothetical protein
MVGGGDDVVWLLLESCWLGASRGFRGCLRIDYMYCCGFL